MPVKLHSILNADEMAELQAVDAEANTLIAAVRGFPRKTPARREAVQRAKKFSMEKAAPLAVKILGKIKTELRGNELLLAEADMKILSDPKRYFFPRPVAAMDLLRRFTVLD
jgi:hypothetical protein